MTVIDPDDDMREVEEIMEPETKPTVRESPKIRPFGGEGQRNEWEAWNCTGKCTYEFNKAGFTCDIQKAIYYEYNPMVTMDIATRMGFIANKDKYGWNCPEFNPKGN
jgi:hypothetical protein